MPRCNSIKLQKNFIETTLWHGCFPVNLLRISRTDFLKNTSGRLFLKEKTSSVKKLRFFVSFASEMLRIARSTTDVINMVTHVKLQLIRMKSKLANVLVSFHYWKKSLGDALKCFVSFHKLLMNLLTSSRYN